tara:strand:- start:99 stop:248 length:150 start_codon:yes stop_codon:yes gene_type:complete
MTILVKFKLLTININNTRNIAQECIEIRQFKKWILVMSANQADLCKEII